MSSCYNPVVIDVGIARTRRGFDCVFCYRIVLCQRSIHMFLGFFLGDDTIFVSRAYFELVHRLCKINRAYAHVRTHATEEDKKSSLTQ